MRALLLVLLLAAAVHADALVLDHDMLTSMARTREPEARISYTFDRVELRTRRSVLAVGWVDVLIVARFERGERGHIRLVAQSLRVGVLEQRGKRFDQAHGALARLVDVDTKADRVEIYRAGKLVYVQEVAP